MIPVAAMASPNDRSTVVGLAAAVGAYGSWGVLPLYFRALSELSAPTVLAHRVVTSIVFLSFVLVIRRELPAVRAAGAHLRPLVASAVLLAINWLVFVWAVNSGRALDTSLGYYINPLLNVLLGVFFLGEALGAAQVAAVGLAVLGVAVQVWGRGGVPWVSLVLAGTFAVYGLLRKRTPVGGAPALFVETVAMAPVVWSRACWERALW
jgi:chloramphenicol-sensitive protein RarD